MEAEKQLALSGLQTYADAGFNAALDLFAAQYYRVSFSLSRSQESAFLTALPPRLYVMTRYWSYAIAAFQFKIGASLFPMLRFI